MQKRVISADFYIGIGLLLFAVLVHSWALDFRTMMDVPGVGAEVFPRVFARMLMLLAVLLAVEGVRSDPNAKKASFKGIHWAALMAALCFIFAALLSSIGYLLLSPVFAVLATAIATRRFRLWDMVPVLGIVVGIYIIFAYLLRVPVPHGILG